LERALEQTKEKIAKFEEKETELQAHISTLESCKGARKEEKAARKVAIDEEKAHNAEVAKEQREAAIANVGIPHHHRITLYTPFIHLVYIPALPYTRHIYILTHL
jgi:DNA repair exonuclease SbcCD ATPase subunit